MKKLFIFAAVLVLLYISNASAKDPFSFFGGDVFLTLATVIPPEPGPGPSGTGIKIDGEYVYVDSKYLTVD